MVTPRGNPPTSRRRVSPATTRDGTPSSPGVTVKAHVVAVREPCVALTGWAPPPTAGTGHEPASAPLGPTGTLHATPLPTSTVTDPGSQPEPETVTGEPAEPR